MRMSSLVGHPSGGAVHSACQSALSVVSSASSNSEETEEAEETTDSALWQALCTAPPEGWPTSELMRITGWKRTKLYRHLREYAEAGRAIQVSRGRWRARATDEPSP